MDLAIILSIIATALSVASFSSTVWRTWRDRPRLLFYVTPVTLANVPKLGELRMARIKISNVGYRPILLTGFMGFGEKSCFAMGIDDEPAATFGKDDQRFPTLLAPGNTLTIHPITLAALERNVAKPENETHFYDPFKYFAAVDSFDRLHEIDADELRFRLRLTTQLVQPKWWQRPKRWFSKKLFLKKSRRRLKS